MEIARACQGSLIPKVRRHDAHYGQLARCPGEVWHLDSVQLFTLLQGKGTARGRCAAARVARRFATTDMAGEIFAGLHSGGSASTSKRPAKSAKSFSQPRNLTDEEDSEGTVPRSWRLPQTA